MLREVCRELAWRTEDFLGEWGGEVVLLNEQDDGTRQLGVE